MVLVSGIRGKSVQVSICIHQCNIRVCSSQYVPSLHECMYMYVFMYAVCIYGNAWRTIRYIGICFHPLCVIDNGTVYICLTKSNHIFIFTYLLYEDILLNISGGDIHKFFSTFTKYLIDRCPPHLLGLHAS